VRRGRRTIITRGSYSSEGAVETLSISRSLRVAFALAIDYICQRPCDSADGT
jgi:hypothetical protein